MTDSRVTPQAVEAAARAMSGLTPEQWRTEVELGTLLAGWCQRDAPLALAAAVPLLCQPLQDENEQLRAEIEELTESRGTERLVHRLQEDRLRVDAGRAPRWEDDPIVIEHGWLDGRCAGCGEALPAAVPVGTGGAE